MDPADLLCGPSQNCRHVGTVPGRAPQFHAVGHVRHNTGQEDGQLRCHTQALAAQDWQALMQRRPAHGSASRLLSVPASVRLEVEYFTVSAVGKRHAPHQRSGASRRAHPDRFPNTITTELGALSNQPQCRVYVSRWCNSL